MICAVILDERDLLRVGLFAIAFPLIAAMVAALRRTQLRVEHLITPERLGAGGYGRVVLAVTNTGSTRTPVIDLTEAAVPDLTGGVHTLVAAIRPGQTSMVGYPLVAARRGRFVIGPPTVRRSDPFGLWEDHRTLPLRTEVLVVPTVVPLVGMPGSTGSQSAASGRSTQSTMGGDPDVGVRPYRSGDDIRTVHWRASARHDELVVRLTEPVSHGGAAVLIDHREVAHRGSGARSSLETAITLAASVTLHLLGADQQVRLLSHHNTVLAQGHDIADDVLASLAMLGPAETSAVERPVVGRTGLLIAVLGSLSARDVATLRAGRSRAVTAVAFLLDAQAWADPEANRSGRDPDGVAELRASGWRVVVVRPTDDLRLAWQRGCVTRTDPLAGLSRSGARP